MPKLTIAESKRTTVSILAVLVIMLSVGAMFMSRRPPPLDVSKIAVGVHEAIGRRAAKETADLLGHEGKVVVVMVDKGDPPITFAEEEVASFIQTIGQTSGVVVVSV